MTDRPCNVLFLCTGSSARSILAEAAMNKLVAGGFRADGLRSKSRDEFAQAGAPEIDFIFTVCDNAAAEMCPVWPGRPMTAHWGIEDPAAVEDDRQRAAFEQALRYLSNRIALSLALPHDAHDRMTLAGRSAIGRSEGLTKATAHAD